MKVEIKHRWNGRVLYSAEIEENPLRETVVRAVRENAYLDGAYLDGASLDGAYLAGASLAGASLAGASLDGASLAGAYLAGAYLAGASLAGASLAGASLDGAYLAGASLDGAYLAGVSLDGAYLAGVSLDDYPWIVGLARLGACGTSLTWLIHCASPEGALVALKPAWRDWLADKGAPVAEGAPAVLAWIEREVAKLPPPPKLEAGDLAKYLFAAQPDPACLDNWLTCRCSIARRLRGRVWVAKWKAARE